MKRPHVRDKSVRARHKWATHPRAAQALKATVSATIAWTLVSLIPGPWSEYPYYAPLGAVVATSTNLMSSTRQSLQAVASIALGALIARSINLVPIPDVVSLALVILIGVGVSGWRRLGTMGTWTTTSALFVLIVGDPDPVGYVSAFVGLTFLGALVGITVNALVPSLPLTPTNTVLDELRDTLADQLDAIAESVEKEIPLDGDGPENLSLAILPVRMRANSAVADSNEAASANWVARRYRTRRERLRAQAAILDRAASTIEGITETICEAQNNQHDDVALAAEIRPAATEALRGTSAALRSLDAGTLDPDAATEAQNAVVALDNAIAAERDRTSGDARLTDGVVVALRQLLQTPTRD